MIDYYKDADEIQEVDERSARSERTERGERRSHTAEEGFSRFFLNFGKTDGLYPNQLIELVNKCVPGKVRIGKIDLRDSFSFFEVEEGESQRVMDNMNGFEIDGKRISVEPAQGKGEGSRSSRGGFGRGGGNSRGGGNGSSRGGYKGGGGYKGKREGGFSGSTSDRRNSEKPWRRDTSDRNARKKRY